MGVFQNAVAWLAHPPPPWGVCPVRWWAVRAGPPLRAPRQEAGGGHVLWAELERPLGRPCLEGEAEAQRGRLARGRTAG